MSSDDNGSSGRQKRNGRADKPLSLWPLTVEEAVEAILQVEPPSKPPKAVGTGQPSKNGESPAHKPE